MQKTFSYTSPKKHLKVVAIIDDVTDPTMNTGMERLEVKASGMYAGEFLAYLTDVVFAMGIAKSQTISFAAASRFGYQPPNTQFDYSHYRQQEFDKNFSLYPGRTDTQSIQFVSDEGVIMTAQIESQAPQSFSSGEQSFSVKYTALFDDAFEKIRCVFGDLDTHLESYIASMKNEQSIKVVNSDPKCFVVLKKLDRPGSYCVQNENYLPSAANHYIKHIAVADGKKTMTVVTPKEGVFTNEQLALMQIDINQYNQHQIELFEF